MSAEMKALVNSPVLWGITLVTIGLVWFLAYYCIARSKKAAKELGMPNEMIASTMKTSVISAIGPSIVIATGMISLLVVAGAPTALMRLSVCGNVSYEMQSMGIAAQMFGAAGTAETMTPEIFQTGVFIMAFGCIGYIIIPVILVTKFDAIVQKISGKDGAFSAIISTAAILGCYAYIDAPYLVNLSPSTAAMLVGFILMYVINRYNNKAKITWLSQWSLFFAMIAGIVAGAIVG